jgi:hypothetical protein
MSKLIALGIVALGALAYVPSANAESNLGLACIGKTSADQGRLRYTLNRVMNTSTTASAVILCPLGYQIGNPQVEYRDNSSSQNISCSAHYYVTQIDSNAGTKTSSGTGQGFLNWAVGPINIGETWYVQCTLPPAAGTAESQMSSVEHAIGN